MPTWHLEGPLWRGQTGAAGGCGICRASYQHKQGRTRAGSGGEPRRVSVRPSPRARVVDHAHSPEQLLLLSLGCDQLRRTPTSAVRHTRSLLVRPPSSLPPSLPHLPPRWPARSSPTTTPASQRRQGGGTRKYETCVAAFFLLSRSASLSSPPAHPTPSRLPTRRISSSRQARTTHSMSSEQVRRFRSHLLRPPASSVLPRLASLAQTRPSRSTLSTSPSSSPRLRAMPKSLPSPSLPSNASYRAPPSRGCVPRPLLSRTASRSLLVPVRREQQAFVSQVLDTLEQVIPQGVDIQLKVLQTLVSLLTTSAPAPGGPPGGRTVRLVQGEELGRVSPPRATIPVLSS